MEQNQRTHSIFLGYLLWIFGFIGAHRFYYGKQITGVIWFFTLGLFFIGWFIDLFLIPSMEREAERRFIPGPVNYNLTWILLTFLGVFGAHRFYMGKDLHRVVIPWAYFSSSRLPSFRRDSGDRRPLRFSYA